MVFCLLVCMNTMHSQVPPRSEEGTGVRDSCSCHVDSGSQAWGLWKSSQWCSKALSRLSSPKEGFIHTSLQALSPNLCLSKHSVGPSFRDSLIV